MIIECIQWEFSVCKTEAMPQIGSDEEYVFTAKTDDEFSVVCRTENAPEDCICRDDGWRAMRVAGTLDFSLVGILAGIAGVLAENKISIFAVSTYNTDYVLTRAADFENALNMLTKNGYKIKR